jgi:hypothetical protein
MRCGLFRFEKALITTEGTQELLKDREFFGFQVQGAKGLKLVKRYKKTDRW